MLFTEEVSFYGSFFFFFDTEMCILKLPWLFSSAANSQYKDMLMMYHNKPWNKFMKHDASNECWKRKG